MHCPVVVALDKPIATGQFRFFERIFRIGRGCFVFAFASWGNFMPDVKERPILMSGPMISAILEGRKTQTRRVINPQPEIGIPDEFIGWTAWNDSVSTHDTRESDPHVVDEWVCPYGYPEQRLWVRETWQQVEHIGDHGEPLRNSCRYRATDQPLGKWRPSIFMPRWACRILLEVTEVRCERLQSISNSDAEAEGFSGWYTPPFHVNGEITDPDGQTPVEEFRELWEKINGKRGVCKTCKGHRVVTAWAGSLSAGTLEQTADDCPDCDGETGYGWDRNPWVWVVSFKRITKES